MLNLRFCGSFYLLINQFYRIDRRFLVNQLSIFILQLFINMIYCLISLDTLSINDLSEFQVFKGSPSRLKGFHHNV